MNKSTKISRLIGHTILRLSLLILTPLYLVFKFVHMVGSLFEWRLESLDYSESVDYNEA